MGIMKQLENTIDESHLMTYGRWTGRPELKRALDQQPGIEVDGSCSDYWSRIGRTDKGRLIGGRWWGRQNEEIEMGPTVEAAALTAEEKAHPPWEGPVAAFTSSNTTPVETGKERRLSPESPSGTAEAAHGGDYVRTGLGSKSQFLVAFELAEEMRRVGMQQH
ncbi:hypothetical protein QJS10_CPB11g00852 [Acorus calamus]|uniref:Uncharacterized protein n=1 Tax=Acorus calamus TaxID=4465 RepID=A0AAV9DU91_ACOCL|nr:hypothetical protein QJS10_CPB11g00852 [Acorus calamus]